MWFPIPSASLGLPVALTGSTTSTDTSTVSPAPYVSPFCGRLEILAPFTLRLTLALRGKLARATGIPRPVGVPAEPASWPWTCATAISPHGFQTTGPRLARPGRLPSLRSPSGPIRSGRPKSTAGSLRSRIGPNQRSRGSAELPAAPGSILPRRRTQRCAPHLDDPATADRSRERTPNLTCSRRYDERDEIHVVRQARNRIPTGSNRLVGSKRGRRVSGVDSRRLVVVRCLEVDLLAGSNVQVDLGCGRGLESHCQLGRVGRHQAVPACLLAVDSVAPAGHRQDVPLLVGIQWCARSEDRFE